MMFFPLPQNGHDEREHQARQTCVVSLTIANYFVEAPHTRLLHTIVNDGPLLWYVLGRVVTTCRAPLRDDGSRWNASPSEVHLLNRGWKRIAWRK